MMDRRGFLTTAAVAAGVPVIMHGNLHPVPAYDRQLDTISELKPWSLTTELKPLDEPPPAHAIMIECRVRGCGDDAWRRLALVEPTDLEGAIVMADLPVGTIVRVRYDKALRAALNPSLAPGLAYDFRGRITNLYLVKADDGAE